MRIAVLAGSLSLALASVASASPAGPIATPHKLKLPAGVTFKPRCPDHSCKSLVAVTADGKPYSSFMPSAFGPPELQSAYHIDPTLGAGVTVAVIDAYGYKAMESDLAFYRDFYHLPPCTIASGCLTVYNANGDTSPLPADNANWIGETALDIQMISAACPLCKIVVIEASTEGLGLETGQAIARKLPLDVISDSWGSTETNESPSEEDDYNLAGVGTFASAGDDGYHNELGGGGNVGPQYPSTSNFVISVGGTHLEMVDTSVDPRGWTETVWNSSAMGAGATGSSCSGLIPKPPYQPLGAACNKRAASDISALGDPETGVDEYIAGQGGWSVSGGTSLASPLMAATFAAAGHADATPAFIYKHPEIFHDITSGTNAGSDCTTNMCVAGPGWDGPTGLGTVDQAKLKAVGGNTTSGPTVTLTFPSDGDHVDAGFTIAATPADGAAYVSFTIDGVRVGALNVAPYQISAPATLADGAHVVAATAFDLDHNSTTTMINVTQGGAGSGSDSGGGGGGGCAAGGSGAGGGVVLALGAMLARRRRSSASV